MKLRLLSQIATLTLAASVCVGKNRQEPTKATSPASNGIMTVQLFLQRVEEANRTAIDTCKLAAARASSAEVMDYARGLEEVHTKTLKSLHELASRNHFNLKSSSSTTYEPGSKSGRGNTSAKTSSSGGAKPQATHMGDLTAKSGAEFDKAYIRGIVESHQKTVSMFEQQKQADLRDAEVQGFIDHELPTLRNHLSKALDIEKKLINSNQVPPSQ